MGAHWELSGSSLGALWELFGSSSQLRVCHTLLDNFCMLMERLFWKIAWGIFEPRPKSAPWKIVMLHLQTLRILHLLQVLYLQPELPFRNMWQNYAVIQRHREGILQLLMLSSVRGSMLGLSPQYDELRSTVLSTLLGCRFGLGFWM